MAASKSANMAAAAASSFQERRRKIRKRSAIAIGNENKAPSKGRLLARIAAPMMSQTRGRSRALSVRRKYPPSTSAPPSAATEPPRYQSLKIEKTPYFKAQNRPARNA